MTIQPHLSYGPAVEPQAADEPGPRASSLPRPIQVGLVGVLLTITGFGLFSALTIPPFRWPDEQAHAGYAITLTQGELPTIETRIPCPEGAEALEARLKGDRRRRGSVWVANHPPGSYLLALPLVAAVDHLGYGDLTNLALRMVNVFAGGLSALLTFALGRELVDERVGLIAAALFVSFPSACFLLSLGMTDGISLAATLASLLAAARILGGKTDRKAWGAMSATLVVDGLTRLTALGVGALLAGATLLVVAKRERRLPWREALLLGLPAMLLSGWFWLGNIVRYGDIAASKYLLQRFAREPRGSVFGMLGRGEVWEDVARRLFTSLIAEAPDTGWFPGAGAVAFRSIEVVIVLGVVIVLVRLVRDQRSAAAPAPGARKLDLWPWLALLLTFTVSWVMMAKHMSGGGSSHVRYVIVALPLIGVTVATAIMGLGGASPAGRYLRSALAVAALVGLFAMRAQQITKYADWMARGAPSLHGALTTPSGPLGLRIAALVIGVVGAVLTASTIGVVIARSLPTITGEQETAGR